MAKIELSRIKITISFTPIKFYEFNIALFLLSFYPIPNKLNGCPYEI
jgi:hypothetical protein